MSTPRTPLAVEVQGLGYAYPENPSAQILTNINLTIKPGDMVAFIGPSGAGKSTLASVILGLQLPTQGSVTIEGTLPRDYVTSNPGSVSLVQQASNLITGTLAENIALGVNHSDVDRDALAYAIDGAELGEWISTLPDGIDTLVDTGSISGGQLQRIGLARALYTRPALLVLDEPTSSLDADTEHRIAASLKRLHGRVTQIVIAHRLTTIEDADVVYLLEGGRITAEGSFAELRKSSPTVARQVELLTFKS